MVSSSASLEVASRLALETLRGNTATNWGAALLGAGAGAGGAISACAAARSGGFAGGSGGGAPATRGFKSPAASRSLTSASILICALTVTLTTSPSIASLTI